MAARAVRAAALYFRDYTHASSYLLARGLNVVTQLVAKRVVDGVDALQPELQHRHHARHLARPRGGPRRVQADRAGQFRTAVHAGRRRPAGGEFSAVLDSPATDFPLFAPPAEPISDTKYAIGLHAAGLVRDGGTLQIGIGQVGDALAQGLIVRHRDNAQFHAIMKRLAPGRGASRWKPVRSTKGLYGVSEMLFEAFLGLIDAGIFKREVDGVMLHGAFFLGPKSFYRALREMPPEQIARIQMMPVSFTNELYGDEEAKRRARVNARFINNAMMATLMGAAISDGLDDGQVVSGVGGQYNFVAQAFALEARDRFSRWSDRQAGPGRIPTSAGTTATRPFRGICATSSSPNTALPTGILIDAIQCVIDKVGMVAGDERRGETWVKQCKVCLRHVFQYCGRTRCANRRRERRCDGGDGSEEISTLQCNPSLHVPPGERGAVNRTGWSSVSDGNSPRLERRLPGEAPEMPKAELCRHLTYGVHNRSGRAQCAPCQMQPA